MVIKTLHPSLGLTSGSTKSAHHHVSELLFDFQQWAGTAPSHVMKEGRLEERSDTFLAPERADV